MKFTFTRELPNELSKVNLDNVKLAVIRKGVEYAEVIDENKIVFKTKNILNYWNFELFSLINKGEWKLENKRVSLTISSIRIWIDTVIFSIFIFSTTGITYSLLLTVLFFSMLYVAIYTGSKRFFNLLIEALLKNHNK